MANSNTQLAVDAVKSPAKSKRTWLLLSTLTRVFQNRMGILGLMFLVPLVVMGAFAPIVAPYDPLEMYRGEELKAPSADHLLGTDEFGRDILSRVIYGARISLLVGIISVVLGVVAGVITGLIAGYWGGAVDSIIMRIWDCILAFPAILLGIGVATVLGPGYINAGIAVAIRNTPIFSRIVRASVLAEREKEYVVAEKALGSSDIRIVFQGILPNCLSPVLVQITAAMAWAVLLEAGLSFLGLGAQPPIPSWGSMLFTGRAFLRDAPWYGIFPGVALTTLILGLNFFSDAFRDALDPRLTREMRE